MKNYLSTLLVLMMANVSCFAQLVARLNPETTNETNTNPLKNLTETPDSLIYKRNMLLGKMFIKNKVADKKAVVELLKNDPQSLKNYKWGTSLTPVGPLMIAGGVGVSYWAVKGKQASAFVEGQNYNYTIRSVPKLVIGIGAILGGLCLVEWSNELQAKAANRYNSNITKKRVTFIKRVRIGVNPEGNIGISAKI